MIWGTLNLKEPQMANNQTTLEDLKVEIVKINLRWRIATSIMSISLAAIAGYGQIKLQEVQSNVVSNEVLKTQVVMLNDSIKDITLELRTQRAMLTDIAMDKLVLSK